MTEPTPEALALAEQAYPDKPSPMGWPCAYSTRCSPEKSDPYLCENCRTRRWIARGAEIGLDALRAENAKLRTVRACAWRWLTYETTADRASLEVALAALDEEPTP